MARKSAANRLEAAQLQLADTEKRLADIREARKRALLADEDAKAGKLRVEIEALQQLADDCRDKVQFLEAEAKREEGEAIAKRRFALVERFAKKLADADAVADELQTTVARADRAIPQDYQMRRMPEPHGRSAKAPLDAVANTAEGCALAGQCDRYVCLIHELWRVGARPLSAAARPN